MHNVDKDHKPFLDEAATQGLEAPSISQFYFRAEGFAISTPWKTQVIPGMSDYPYTQMPDNCMQTDSFVDPCSRFRS